MKPSFTTYRSPLFASRSGLTLGGVMLVSLLLLLSVKPAHSQFVVDYKKQGDQFFSEGKYYAAAVLYQKALGILPDTMMSHYVYPYTITPKSKKQEKNKKEYAYLVYQLGDAFRLYKDYKSALDWYQKAEQLSTGEFPMLPLWEGVCLRANKRYEEAITHLEAFKSAYGKSDEYSRQADLELKSCRFALDQMEYPRLSDIAKLPAPVNSGESGSNYAPLLKDQQLYFTSSRPLRDINEKKDDPFVNKLYSAAEAGTGSFDSVEMLALKNTAKTMQLAAMTFTPDGGKAFITGWTNKAKGEKQHKAIYMISKDGDGTWSEPGAPVANLNIAGSDAMEPFVTADGKYVFFSSNRPGGQGGYDIWYSELGADGAPATAINLGNTVNTLGDEEAPFYDPAEKKLVFSSNGRVGMGGYDLFVSRGMADNWTMPVNMGAPVNSEKDDIFYSPRPEDTTVFYTSSDRQSVCCLEVFRIKLKHITIGGTLLDCDTQQPIAGAKVELRDSASGEVLKTQILDESGRYRLEVNNVKALKMTASKQNYFTKSVDISSNELRRTDTLFSPDLCLKAYEINKPIVIPNVYYDFDKATLRPESKVVLDTLYEVLMENPKMQVELSAHTDSKGSDKYNMGLSQRRAQSCVDYLISKGIDAGRLTAKGYGESRPIAPNTNPDGSDNPEGRQKNRRTEFVVLKNE
ncbi:OmpA family protein [Compostibacter hankyongensis]|uniref:OmpA family protein n=1 Tax=Compostibacter hankyongensis TaxID=1007089 RepID=A0ABP8G0M3_9BACT